MAAGDSFTFFKPVFLLGDLYPTAAVLPALSLARTVPPAWPTGWTPIRGYQNGARLTFQNPKVAIQMSDLGIGAYIGTGAHGQQLAIQFRKPTAALMKKLMSLFTVTKAAVVGPPAFPAAELLFQDANDELDTNPTSEFRVGLEGIAQANSLYATKRVARYIGFRGQQGGNVLMAWDHTGNDAGYFPQATIQMLDYTATTAELTGSGVAAGDIKDTKGMLQFIE